MVVFVTVALIGSSGQALGQSSQVVSRFGQTQVAGRDVVVHVSVIVPPGAVPDQVTLDALRNQGARPFQTAEFQTTGLLWDGPASGSSVPVTINYNEDGDSTGGLGFGELMAAEGEWSSSSNVLLTNLSNFDFFDGGLTGRCPSFISQCKGPQIFDELNDVG